MEAFWASVRSTSTSGLDECGKNDPALAGVSDDKTLGSFVDDLRDWAKICDRLYVWDYVVNFKHTLMPFPNLRVLQPNIRFFLRSPVLTGLYRRLYARNSGPADKKSEHQHYYNLNCF